MITIRDRYVPTEKALTGWPHPSWIPSPHDDTYSRTAEQAFHCIYHSLSFGHSVREVKAEGDQIKIVTSEYGRNTRSLFENTFTGPLSEMIGCLVVVYYRYDGHCVEPPLDYPFTNPGTRQEVLDDIKKWLPRRDEVGALLRRAGYEPPVLEGLYDIRGCAPENVAVMVYAGITDPKLLTIGAAMCENVLFEACEYMRTFEGMTFDEALQQTRETNCHYCNRLRKEGASTQVVLEDGLTVVSSKPGA